MFKVSYVSALQSEAPLGVFCVDSAVSGIFFLHPVRHSSAWILSPSQWHTHTHAQSVGVLLFSRGRHTHCRFGHTDVCTPPVWHRLWSNTQRRVRRATPSPEAAGAWLTVPMVTLMPCVFVWVCESVRMEVGESETEQGKCEEMDEQWWRSKHIKGKKALSSLWNKKK